MRILHTSDWHLGRSFHGVGMLDAQAAYVDHLVETVEAEAVDLVLVSGDVYDRALPPVDAIELADDTFARLAASRAQVVVTSGNHDSAGPARASTPGSPTRPACTCAPAGRTSAPRCCSRTSTARSRSTASPTSSPTRSASLGPADAAATRPR